MKRFPLGPLSNLAICFGFILQVPPAQSGPQIGQATSLMQRSITRQTGGGSVMDVRMIGTARVMHGSSAEAGDIVLEATAAAWAQVTLTLPSGSRIDVRDYAGPIRTGTYKGPDGLSYSLPSGLLTGPHPAWFYPAFIMASALSSSRYTCSRFDPETTYGMMAEHIAIWPQGAIALPVADLRMQYVGQRDVYLDRCARIQPARDSTSTSRCVSRSLLAKTSSRFGGHEVGRR